MKYQLILLFSASCSIFSACSQAASPKAFTDTKSVAPSPGTIGAVALPGGYQRVALSPGTFGSWLRKIALKADHTVYLYNGQKKANQTAQFAVLDIPVGTKDLQQCADAVMRLYGEYLYGQGRYRDIQFNATDGSRMDYTSWMQGYRFSERANKLRRQLAAAPCKGRDCFEGYLQTVFSYAGTLSLNRELQVVPDIKEITAGDVFIKGGSPGHAVLVVDIAYEEGTGKKLFLLAQSYMPAQDIHILRNPASADLSPWYSAGFIGDKLYTPEWIFKKGELKRFR